MSLDLVIRRGVFALNFLAPLAPVLAGVIHGRSGRYRSFPWMRRLSALLLFLLVESWAMLGTAANGIHNAWLADLFILPEALFLLWVLSTLPFRRIPGPVAALLAGLLAVGTAWDAYRVRLAGIWPVAGTLAGLVLLGLCLWQLYGFLVASGAEPLRRHPAFWFLGSWSVLLTVELTFYPLHDHFLRRLSGIWVLLPWCFKYLAGFLLNLGIARTFLCPNPRSS